MLNPYATLDPYRNLYGSSLNDPTRQESPITPLSQPEEDSLLSKIGGATLGGIGWAGRHLEALGGGRAIRGVLGGHPEELASLIPFSDEMGLTDYKNRVSGQQLLGLGNNNDWGSWAVGLGAEIATDPLSYLSFGGSALGEAGEVASKVGLMKGVGAAERAGGTLSSVLEKAGSSPDLLAAADAAAQKGGSSLADLAGTSHWSPRPGIMGPLTPEASEAANAARAAEATSSPNLGGLVGVGLPFMKPSILLGSGQGGADFANAVGKGASWLGNKIPGGSWAYQHVIEPAGRVRAMLFDKPTGGTLSAGSQAEARAMAAAEPAALAAARQRYLGVVKPLLDAGMLSPGQSGQTSDSLTALLENRASLAPNTPQGQAMAQALPLAQQAMDAGRATGTGLGRDIGYLEDYAPRQQGLLEKQTKGYGPTGGEDFSITSGNEKGRLEALRDLPKPTVNAMSVDEMISGPNAKLKGLQAQAHIRQNYLDMGPSEELERFGLNDAANKGPLSAGDEARRLTLNAKVSQSEDLESIMAGQDPQRAANNMPIFGNNQLDDLRSYLNNNARANLGSQARHNILAAGAELGPPTRDTASALDALEKVGLTSNTAATGTDAATGGQASLLAALKQRGVLPEDADSLMGVRVGQQAIDDATQYGSKGFQLPPALRPLRDLYDSATNLTKGWMSSFWPSSIMRDLTSGVWQHSAEGMGSPLDALTNQAAASTLRQGKVLENAGADFAHVPGMAGLSDLEASKKLRDLMYIHDVQGGEGGQAGDILGAHQQPGGPLAPNAPDAAQASLLSQANPSNFVPKSLAEANPIGVRGVGGRTETTFAPIRAGQNLRESIYDTQMGGSFLSGLKQGYSPAEAANQAYRVNYDYGNLTPFENNVMRRVAPYYNWMRQNIPAQLSQLAQHPGGMQGVAARVASNLRAPGLLPESVRDDLAIPVGQEQGGTQRFLSTLDLPPENAFDMIQEGPQQWQRMAMGLLGETNPLIKGPLELATGKQFYSGRDLGDLFSTTGNGLLEQALMNSPASRVLSTARTLTDPRKDILTKALNLGTGAKVTDVNMDQARTTAARQYIQDSLSQRPEISHFENIAPRSGQEQNLTPEEVALLRLNKTIEAQSAAAAKQRIGVRR